MYIPLIEAIATYPSTKTRNLQCHFLGDISYLYNKHTSQTHFQLIASNIQCGLRHKLTENGKHTHCYAALSANSNHTSFAKNFHTIGLSRVYQTLALHFVLHLSPLHLCMCHIAHTHRYQQHKYEYSSLHVFNAVVQLYKGTKKMRLPDDKLGIIDQFLKQIHIQKHWRQKIYQYSHLEQYHSVMDITRKLWFQLSQNTHLRTTRQFARIRAGSAFRNRNTLLLIMLHPIIG